MALEASEFDLRNRAIEKYDTILSASFASSRLRSGRAHPVAVCEISD
jgi:hypothetical protein